MKKITFLAALMLALSVAAQQPAKEPAKEPAKPVPVQEPAKAEPAKPATVAEAPKAPKKHTPTRRTEDARQCLDKGGSNTDIIKCAEEYL